MQRSVFEKKCITSEYTVVRTRYVREELCSDCRPLRRRAYYIISSGATWSLPNFSLTACVSGILPLVPRCTVQGSPALLSLLLSMCRFPPRRCEFCTGFPATSASDSVRTIETHAFGCIFACVGLRHEMLSFRAVERRWRASVRIGWWFRGVGETLRVSTVATYLLYLLKSGHNYLGLLWVLRRHISM